MGAEYYPEAEQNYPSGSFQPPSQLMKDIADSMQLVKVLTEHDKFLEVIKREMRGEQLYQDESGETYWRQVDRPMFVKLDKLEKPVRTFNKKSKQWEFMAHDDAINEVISVLKSCGLNPISPLTTLDNEEIRQDLLEIESKIAVMLAVKRKKWGIDKALYPINVSKLKTLVKDSRFRAKDGTVLKALRTITQRIEQSREMTQSKGGVFSKVQSPFS